MEMWISMQWYLTEQRGVSAAQLQRKPSESPEEHIARITALLNTVAEAMAIAVIEQKRKLRDRKVNNPKMKL